MLLNAPQSPAALISLGLASCWQTINITLRACAGLATLWRGSMGRSKPQVLGSKLDCISCPAWYSLMGYSQNYFHMHGQSFAYYSSDCGLRFRTKKT